MRLSATAIKALARLRDLDPAPAGPSRAGFGELLEAGLVTNSEDGWVLTETGRSFPVDEVASFGSAVEEVSTDEAALDRARRARNNAAARLSEKLSLAEIGDLAGVSKQRVAQWIKEGKEG